MDPVKNITHRYIKAVLTGGGEFSFNCNVPFEPKFVTVSNLQFDASILLDGVSILSSDIIHSMDNRLGVFNVAGQVPGHPIKFRCNTVQGEVTFYYESNVSLSDPNELVEGYLSFCLTFED